MGRAFAKQTQTRVANEHPGGARSGETACPLRRAETVTPFAHFCRKRRARLRKMWKFVLAARCAMLNSAQKISPLPIRGAAAIVRAKSSPLSLMPSSSFSSKSSVGTALVIGAGVVGFACALQLLRRGFAVTLLSDERGGDAASWGNAGHLASEQVAPLASFAALRSAWQRRYARGGPVHVRDLRTTAPWIARYLRASLPHRFRRGKAALRLLLECALPAWHRLAQELGDPGLVREAGHLVLWESERSAARGRSGWRRSDIGSASCGPLSAEETALLARLLPQLRIDGIRFRATGQVRDLVALSQRLRDRFVARGGIKFGARVSELRLRDRQAEAVLEDASTLHADRVVVCAGVDSDVLMRTLGEPAPLVAERGYHVEWREHDWPAAMPPTVFEDRSVILTRFDSGLRLAGFTEFAHRETPPDPSKWSLLETHARELGLPVRGAPRRWMGARPTLPDYLPAIGRSRVADNVLYAFGHQHLGLTLAAITGELIAALATGAYAPRSIDAFDLARFGACVAPESVA